MAFKFVLLAGLASVAIGAPQQQFARRNDGAFNLDFRGFEEVDDTPATTPIPILRHIDTQNPDGSYTFGYESGDGTYKIETRFANGHVKGKYGFYDNFGQFNEVEYGDTGLGFEPRIEGVVVAPPSQPEPEVVTSLPEQIAAPTPAPVRQAPRQATVVRRRRPRPQAAQRPVAQPAPQPAAPRSFAPVQREQPRSAAFQAQPAPVNRFVPQDVSVSGLFANHPYIAPTIDFARGSYSFSYGK